MWFVCDGCGIVCLFFTYVLLFTANYIVLTVGAWPVGPIASRVCTALYECWFVLSIWSQLACTLTDPGAVPRNVEVGDGMKMCSKCNAPKPARAHHCSTCKRCILKMDHHCPWVNNCVGARNQKYFLQYLLYIQLQCWAAVCSLCSHASAVPPAHRRRSRGFLVKAGDSDMARAGPQNGTPISDSSIIACVLIFFVAIIFGLFTCIMMCDQLTNITSNSTGIENLQGSGAKARPWRESLQEVMGRGPSIHWLVPFPLRRGQVKDQA
jgi:hypothetical protein